MAIHEDLIDRSLRSLMLDMQIANYDKTVSLFKHVRLYIAYSFFKI